MRFNVIKNVLVTYVKGIVMLKSFFPDDLKIARITLIYKAYNNSNVSNYRSFSVLPGFFKMLEQIMYNRLQNYSKNQNILYVKQLGFET